MTLPPRRILLADADAFYVAVARMVDPEGAGKASLLIVGGSRESRGVVCSASYETRKFGVRSAMPISRALRLCPDAVCVPIPRGACSKKSREIRAVLEQFTPVVEGASIDEWYLDLDGTEALYHHEPLATTARRIRDAVVAQTGLTVSIGGGTNKLVAKVAVEYAKPKTGADGVCVVALGDEARFMERLMLADIPMVGPKFQERLAKLGMRSVCDVLPYSQETLEQWLGKREGWWLYDRVRGVDTRIVEQREVAKSISRDETFARDINDDKELEQELLRLVTRAGADLRKEGITARTVTVRVRDYDFKNRSAGKTLRTAVMTDRVLYAEAKELLMKLRAGRRVPVRLVSVTLSSLGEDLEGNQMGLFDGDTSEETERDRVIAKMMDGLRERFGNAVWRR